MAKKPPIVWKKANNAFAGPMWNGVRPSSFQNFVSQIKAPAMNIRSPMIPGSMPQFGGNNNYQGLIGGSPDLSELEALSAAQGRADKASMLAALRRMAVSYGDLGSLDPASLGGDAKNYWNEALDQGTRDLAAKAEQEGVSVHARQAKDNAVAVRRIPATLAARGMLRSGQTGSDLADQGQNYKNLQYDTLNELLGNVEGSVGGFMQAERDRQMALAQARIQAAWDAAQNWGDYPVGPESPYGPPGPSTNPVNTRRLPVYSFRGNNGRRVKGYTLRPWSGTRGGGV